MSFYTQRILDDEDPWEQRRADLESVGVFLCYAEDIDETGGWSPEDAEVEALRAEVEHAKFQRIRDGYLIDYSDDEEWWTSTIGYAEDEE